MHRSKSFAFDFRRVTQYGMFRLSSIFALAMLGLGTSPLAASGISISSPAGLHPGDTFRIAFITQGRTAATSSDITYYNDFVNSDAAAQAGGGTVTYHGTPVTFSAIASTSTTNAIDNIGQTGAPVYLADGTQIAASDTSAPGGMWSGADPNKPPEDLLGNVTTFASAWTGTSFTGLAAESFRHPDPRIWNPCTRRVHATSRLDRF